jgi:hypothetical protein
MCSTARALAALAIFVFFHPIDDKVAVVERNTEDAMLGPFPVRSKRIRVEDLWKNVMAVEKYEEEKKLLTGASGDLGRLSHPGGRLGELNPRLWVASSLNRARSREVGVQKPNITES